MGDSEYVKVTRNSIKCPFCGSLDTYIMYTSDKGDYVDRIRMCKGCYERFKTTEATNTRWRGE